MNILHITEDFSRDSGGLRTVIKGLDQRLNEINNINSLILSAKQEKDDGIEILAEAENTPWLYSKNWSKKLDAIVLNNNIHIFHIHGVWMYLQFIAAKYAIKNRIPFIVSCHGMYEPWLWRKGSIKKKIYFNFLSKPVFSKANYIHAITRNERNEIKRLIPQVKTIEIPNLIDVSDKETSSYKANDKYILYLGRLDPKKGIDLLINAFKNVDPKDFKLKIAGSFNDYKKTLEILVSEKKLENKVEFLGIVTGKEKEKLYKRAFVFVAPSYSEVVGMVNLEAASLGTPVITTFQTGINQEWKNNGGYLINPSENELTKALEEASSLSLEERNNNGKKLRNFVLKNYSWKNRFSDWVKFYESML